MTNKRFIIDCKGIINNWKTTNSQTNQVKKMTDFLYGLFLGSSFVLNLVLAIYCILLIKAYNKVSDDN